MIDSFWYSTRAHARNALKMAPPEGQRPQSLIAPRARAEEVVEAQSEALVEAGINRLSVGVQSLEARHLRFLGRLHDAEGARREARSTLSTSERLSLRVLLARAYMLLGKADQAEDNEQGAARNFAQATRILDEVRNESSEEDPFQRRDLQALYAEVSGG